MFTSVCFLALMSMAAAHPSYKSLIPNGDRVPDPCLSGNAPGVGHVRTQGGGALNEFGMALQAAGLVWTKVLCMEDSDKDGLTNGEELGDPHCHFTPGGHAHLTTPLGHPGVCEPVGSQACAWQNFSC